MSGGRPDASNVLDTLVIRTVLPLVALVLGTAALGSEIDDGTVVHLLVKPIARRWIVLASAVVAAGLTAVLVVPSVVLTGLLTSGLTSSSITVDVRLRDRRAGRRHRLLDARSSRSRPSRPGR